MKLTCVSEASLPPLAYCLRARGGSIDVVHGPLLATGTSFFHDGAWAGDFGEAGFTHAYSCGTGGVVEGERMTLSTPEMPIECLFLVTRGDTTLASNSLACLLEVTDDSLDVEHLGYRDEMMAVERGTRLSRLTIPTAGGASIRVLLGEIARIGPSGRIDITKRPRARSFDDWADYIATLKHTLGAVVANAGDPRREHPYEPLTPMSYGYDSTAVASLVAGMGATDAITMLRYDTDGTTLLDHPGPIACALNMNLLEVPRDTWRKRTDLPEAQIAAGLTTFGDVSFLALDEWLPGRLLLTGGSGDNLWDPHNHRYARGVVHGYGKLAGRGLIEHRLHIGYVRCSPAEIAHSAHPSIHKILRSVELRPWSIGGTYDRPIPRRIAEEAGVQRSSFGVRKLAASARVGNARQHSSATTRAEMQTHLLEVMSPTSTESFLQFLDGIDTSAFRSRMATGRIWHRLYEKVDALNHHAGAKLHRAGIRSVIPKRTMRRLARRGATDFDYTRWLPHWGVEHVKESYAGARRIVGTFSQGETGADRRHL